MQNDNQEDLVFTYSHPQLVTDELKYLIVVGKTDRHITAIIQQVRLENPASNHHKKNPFLAT